MHCSLMPDAFEEPGTWGAVMADLARHVASALAEDGHKPEDVMAAIREGFLAEIAEPMEE